MTAPIVDELMGLADAYADAVQRITREPDGIFTSRDSRTALHTRLRELLEGEAVALVYPDKPAPRYSGYIPDGSGVEWNAYDTSQMEAYARAVYARCAGRRIDAAAFSDEQLDAALMAMYSDSGWKPEAAGSSHVKWMRDRMRSAISAALVQP